MKKALLFIVQLPFFGLFQNCGPKVDTRPVYEIDQTTIDYCVYDQGSWWVYEEEKSGERDTITVESVNILVDDNEKYNSIQKGYRTVYHSNLFQNLNSWGGGQYDDKIFFGSFHIILPHRFEDLEFFSTSDTSEVYQIREAPQIKLKDTLSKIKIKDSTYNNIRIFENLIGTYPNYQKTIFWARHIGKIRVERADGTVWNLIDYHVSQDNL